MDLDETIALLAAPIYANLSGGIWRDRDPKEVRAYAIYHAQQLWLDVVNREDAP